MDKESAGPNPIFLTTINKCKVAPLKPNAPATLHYKQVTGAVNNQGKKQECTRSLRLSLRAQAAALLLDHFHPHQHIIGLVSNKVHACCQVVYSNLLTIQAGNLQ